MNFRLPFIFKLPWYLHVLNLHRLESLLELPIILHVLSEKALPLCEGMTLDSSEHFRRFPAEHRAQDELDAASLRQGQWHVAGGAADGLG